MTVAFDENVQERDCVVLFKFNGEFDVCVTVNEVVQKLSCCVFTVKQGEGIVILHLVCILYLSGLQSGV